MKIAFIIDPIESLKPHKDSSIEMMRAAQERGHEVWALAAESLSLHSPGAVSAHATQLKLTSEPGWYKTLGSTTTLPLTHFDAVLMRKDPPFDQEFLYATWLLELAEQQGARIINRPSGIRDFNEKLATARFPHLAPPLVVTKQNTLLRSFIAEHGDVILKPLDGMGGSGIFRVHEKDANLSVILETLTHHGQRTIMAQRYLPAIVDGDKRVLVIHGQVMPYCLARIPAQGETRGNLAAGGRGEARPISARDREIAETVAPALMENGLMIVGLDVIGDHLTEINVTSPTCMREIRDQTGFDVAREVILGLESGSLA
jgi:glutathione synthase